MSIIFGGKKSGIHLLMFKNHSHLLINLETKSLSVSRFFMQRINNIDYFLSNLIIIFVLIYYFIHVDTTTSFSHGKIVLILPVITIKKIHP